MYHVYVLGGKNRKDILIPNYFSQKQLDLKYFIDGHKEQPYRL